MRVKTTSAADMHTKYIHGSGDTSAYLNLDPSFKNPASSETNGLKVTIDGTAIWNGQNMERTELIPQTSENLGVSILGVCCRYESRANSAY